MSGYGAPRKAEHWPCGWCNREHPARPSYTGGQPSAYCPELGMRVYSKEALQHYDGGRCP